MSPTWDSATSETPTALPVAAIVWHSGMASIEHNRETLDLIFHQQPGLKPPLPPPLPFPPAWPQESYTASLFLRFSFFAQDDNIF